MLLLTLALKTVPAISTCGENDSNVNFRHLALAGVFVSNLLVEISNMFETLKIGTCNTNT